MILHASGPVHIGHAWHVSTCFYCMAIEREKVEMVTDFLFLGSKITADGDCSREIRWCHSSCDEKPAAAAAKSLQSCPTVCDPRDSSPPGSLVPGILQARTLEWVEKPRQSVEMQRHYSADTGLHSQGFGPPSGHVQLWELDHKEGRASKNWYLWTLVLEKTPESPLDSKEIKPVNLKEDQPWILVGRTDAEVEAPIFWSSDVNRQLTGKVPDTGKDWGQKEKRAPEDEMIEWCRWCNRHELMQTSGENEGQGGLECCRPCGHKASDMTGLLKNKNPIMYRSFLQVFLSSSFASF